MGDTKTLLPCPFCGGDATERKDSDSWLDGYYHFYVECRGCKARSQRFHAHVDDSHGGAAAAIAAWNRRASHEARIAELEEALRGLLKANDDVQLVLCDGPEVPGFDPTALGKAQGRVTEAERAARRALHTEGE